MPERFQSNHADTTYRIFGPCDCKSPTTSWFILDLMQIHSKQDKNGDNKSLFADIWSLDLAIYVKLKMENAASESWISCAKLFFPNITPLVKLRCKFSKDSEDSEESDRRIERKLGRISIVCEDLEDLHRIFGIFPSF